MISCPDQVGDLFRSISLSNLARLLVYSLIRQNPAERPSAKEIITSDWFKTETFEPTSTPCLNAFNRPNLTIRIMISSSGRPVSEMNPRIPQQLLDTLTLSANARNSRYQRQPSLRASMESFANALNRSMVCFNNMPLIRLIFRMPQTRPVYEQFPSLRHKKLQPIKTH